MGDQTQSIIAKHRNPQPVAQAPVPVTPPVSQPMQVDSPQMNNTAMAQLQQLAQLSNLPFLNPENNVQIQQLAQQQQLLAAAQLQNQLNQNQNVSLYDAAGRKRGPGRPKKTE